MDPKQWMEEQLPGLEDEVLWYDMAIVVSIPAQPRPGLTNKVNVRRLDHANYLEWGRRTMSRDSTTGLALDQLPWALDEAIEAFHRAVIEKLAPFI